MYYFKYIILFLTQSIHCAWDSGSHGSDWRTVSCGKWYYVVRLKFTYVSWHHAAYILKCAAVHSSLTVIPIIVCGTTYKNIFQLTWNYVVIKNSNMSHEWHSLHEFHFCVDVISTVRFCRCSPQLILITVHCTLHSMNLKRLCMKIEIGSGSFL